MAEAAVQFLKIAVRISFVFAGILAFIMLLNFAYGFVFVTLNQNVLSDLFVMVQAWTPFNLGVLLSWIVASSTIYMTYRLTVASIAYVSRLVGHG